METVVKRKFLYIYTMHIYDILYIPWTFTTYIYDIRKSVRSDPEDNIVLLNIVS